jgi:hypothetical protein
MSLIVTAAPSSLRGTSNNRWANWPAQPSTDEDLASKPLGALPAEMDAGQPAAWTVVASVLLNWDGVLTKG